MRIAFTSLLFAACVTANAQLQFDTDYGHALPTFHVEQRLAELDKELTELREHAPRVAANERKRLVNAASIQVRAIARNLLRQADGSIASSDAVLAGMTLATRVQQFDELFATYLDMPEGAAAQRMGDALKRFTAEQRTNLSPEGADLAAVRSYLNRTMSSLLAAAAVADETPIASAWPPPLDGKAATPGFASPVPTADDFNALATRVEQIASAAEARAEIVKVLQLLARAAPIDEYGPQTADSYRLMVRIVDYLVALDAADWLGDGERTSIEADLRDAMVLYQNPRQRIAAERMIEQLFAFEALLANMAIIEADDQVVEGLRSLFAVALGQLRGPTTRDVGAALLQWVTRATTTIVRHRKLSVANIETDLRIAFGRFNQHYLLSEALVGRVAHQLTDNPRGIVLPSANVSLWYLDTRCHDLDRLIRLSGYGKRMKDVASYNSEDATRQVTHFTRLLEDPTVGLEASRAISRFDRQVRLFAMMHAEPDLRESVDKRRPPASPYLGDRAARLLEVINSQRRQWVAAWAQGDIASEAGQRLEDLALLMLLLDRSASLERLCGDEVILSRWGGVEISPVAVRRVAANLRQTTKYALDAAMAEDWQTLERAMRNVRGEHLGALVLVEIDHQLNSRLAAMNDAARMTLSQLLIDPWPDALLGDRRHDLAILSRCLSELAHPSLSESNPSRAEAQDHATLAARAIANDLPAIRVMLVDD